MNCLICGSNTREILAGKIIYHKCNYCEFIFKDDKYIISKDEELCIYNRHNNSIDDIKYVAYFKKFIDNAIIPFFDKGFGLDFGSGPSPVFSMIMKRDYGFDMDIYDYFYQREKVYEGKKYDFITSTEVFEHLRNPIDYFELMKKHLKKNGYLCLMTLFHHNDDEKFVKWHYIRDKSHISFYSKKTIEVIAEMVSFEIVYFDDYRYITLRK